MSTLFFKRGARPIESMFVQEHYKLYSYQKISLNDYSNCWRSWLTTSNNKKLIGLENFLHSDYVQGSSQTFDHFVLKHSALREIVTFIGDFQYHSCISKKVHFRNLQSAKDLTSNQALLISLPFSDFGTTHPQFIQILNTCNKLSIPVCVDLAYWGIAKNVNLNINDFPCITEITSSLSKPFYTLENHRVGIRFSKNYLDDGISMLNEVQMQNFYSMGLGIHYMLQFSCDWNWQQYGNQYQDICRDKKLIPTDTIIFGIDNNDKYNDFNRGIPGNNRICISPLLKDIL